jgi:hypothetical protein
MRDVCGINIGELGVLCAPLIATIKGPFHLTVGGRLRSCPDGRSNKDRHAKTQGFHDEAIPFQYL